MKSIRLFLSCCLLSTVCCLLSSCGSSISLTGENNWINTVSGEKFYFTESGDLTGYDMPQFALDAYINFLNNYLKQVNPFLNPNDINITVTRPTLPIQPLVPLTMISYTIYGRDLGNPQNSKTYTGSGTLTLKAGSLVITDSSATYTGILDIQLTNIPVNAYFPISYETITLTETLTLTGTRKGNTITFTNAALDSTSDNQYVKDRIGEYFGMTLNYPISFAWSKF